MTVERLPFPLEGEGQVRFSRAKVRGLSPHISSPWSPKGDLSLPLEGGGKR